MAFNISEFSSNIARLGTTRNSLFVVSINGLPSRLQNLESEIPTKDLRFLCKSAVIPGLSVSTNPISPNNIGMMERRAVSMEQFAILPLQFMMDSEFRTYRFFHKWIQNVVNYNNDSPFASINNDQLPYEVAYKDNIVAPNITIDVYSDTQAKYSVELFNAYPVEISEVGLAWENAGDVMTVGVGFTYDRIRFTGTQQGTLMDPSANRASNIVTNPAELAQFTQLISPAAGTNLQNIVDTLTTLVNR